MKSNWRNKIWPANLLLAAGAAFSGAAHAVNDLPGGPSVRQLNLPVGVTKIAQEQHFLHTVMMILCTVIFVAVFAVMFYSIWKHRKSVGHKAANFHESVVVEVIWTIVPFIIVILMALPATRVLVAQKDTTNSDLTIKVTGYQWKWGYDYLKGEGEGLDSSRPSTVRTARCPTPVPGVTCRSTSCSRSTTPSSCRSIPRSASSRRPMT